MSIFAEALLLLRVIESHLIGECENSIPLLENSKRLFLGSAGNLDRPQRRPRLRRGIRIHRRARRRRRRRQARLTVTRRGPSPKQRDKRQEESLHGGLRWTTEILSYHMFCAVGRLSDTTIQRVPKRAPIPAPAGDGPAPGVPWLRILVWLLASRLILAMMAGFSSMVLEPGHNMGTPSSFWEAILRWDTGWFFSVVQQGYFFDPGRASNIPFMPLFPALVWIFSLGRTIDPHAVGVLISNAALFYGCVSIWRITHRRWNSVDTADLSVILVLVSPVSFFFSIFYSEGLFLCAVAACLDEAERERWLYAGLWGMAASLDRKSTRLNSSH